MNINHVFFAMKGSCAQTSWQGFVVSITIGALIFKTMRQTVMSRMIKHGSVVCGPHSRGAGWGGSRIRYSIK